MKYRKRITLEDRDALRKWEDEFRALMTASTIDEGDSVEVIRMRRERLEKDPEAWFSYYFPGYCTAEPAPFHKRATRRLLKHKKWMETRAWSRELAKSARSMMEVLYLALTKQIKTVLLVSNSLDNAKRLLLPFQGNLERSARIIQDYGVQQKLGAWEEGEFTTTGGVSFRALGAGQSPRGTRNEASRPDFVIVDDIDTDEKCRNSERVKQDWRWVTEALIPAMSVSGNRRVLFNGNIIAKDSVITRTKELVDHFDIVNIRDDEGKSVWASKNSEEDIDDFLSKLPMSAVQKEFYNNPVTEGEVFVEMVYGKCPPLRQLQFVVCYGDPSPSNKVRSKGASFKSVVLVGFLRGRYYVYKVFLEQTTNDNYLEWFYAIRDYVGDACPVYYYNENNALQDPFWEQVLQPLLFEKAQTRGTLSVIPDTRAKMDKYARIEASLEPLNRNGQLILNEEERGNPHMQRLEEQFLTVAPLLPAPADGPDSVEGAIWITNYKLQTITSDTFYIGQRPTNNKRY